MMDISSIALWFRRAMPNPTDKNRAVQMGVHFEEVGEHLDAIDVSSLASYEIKRVAEALKRSMLISLDAYRDDQQLELLDALCDQVVTALGTGHTFGFDMLGALAEVDRSNWSKFVDGQPIFDANGKIAKPPTFSKPDLRPFLRKALSSGLLDLDSDTPMRSCAIPGNGEVCDGCQ